MDDKHALDLEIYISGYILKSLFGVSRDIVTCLSRVENINEYIILNSVRTAVEDGVAALKDRVIDEVIEYLSRETLTGLDYDARCRWVKAQQQVAQPTR